MAAVSEATARAVGELHVALAQAYGADWCDGDERASRALAAKLAESLKDRPAESLRTAALALGDELLRPALPPALPALGRWLDSLVAEWHAPDEARELHRALCATYGARWRDLGGLPALFAACAEAGVDITPQACRSAHERWLREREGRWRYAPPLPAELAGLALRRTAGDHALFRHFACGDPAPEGLGEREAAAGRAAAREVGRDRLAQLRAAEAEALFMQWFRHFLVRPDDAPAARPRSGGGDGGAPAGDDLAPADLARFLDGLADEVEAGA